MIHDFLIPILNSLPIERLNIVDVGCHKGHFKDALKPMLTKPNYWVGIDPCFYEEQNTYDRYFTVAIDNVIGPTQTTLYKYVEPGCNSIIPMNMRLITHNKAAEDEKWYVGRVIEEETERLNTSVRSLHDVIITEGLPLPIHFLKIDAQGSDIEVFKSLREVRQHVLFVQIESVTTHNESLTLYKRQSIFEQDLAIMVAYGFDLFALQNWGFQASPEADVIFYNKELLRAYK